MAVEDGEDQHGLQSTDVVKNNLMNGTNKVVVGVFSLTICQLDGRSDHKDIVLATFVL